MAAISYRLKQVNGEPSDALLPQDCDWGNKWNDRGMIRLQLA
jgi:hypothetical protein